MQRLWEPPSPAASKGTLVHRALELLHNRPAQERTRDAALSDLQTAAAELAADPEFAELHLTAEQWQSFVSESEVFVERYLQLEDPTTINAVGLELKLEAKLGKVTLRGIIDRLDLTPEGDLVVTDYKTGKAPSERFLHKSLEGVHLYALLCEQNFGKRPVRVQLLYLSKPEAIVATPTESTVRGVEVKSGALMTAIKTACVKDDFRPRTSPLCNYCSFKDFCPSFGGDPETAATVTKERARAAQHLATARLSIA